MAVIGMHHNLAGSVNCTMNTSGKQLKMADTTTNYGKKLCIKSRTRSEGEAHSDRHQKQVRRSESERVRNIGGVMNRAS
eukprot:13278953-Heterocapsa_arctica.AAC.1